MKTTIEQSRHLAGLGVDFKTADITYEGGTTMKGNFWHKIFRKGYDADYPHGDAAKYNGNMAKTDAKTTISKLKRFLDKVYKVEEQQ